MSQNMTDKDGFVQAMKNDEYAEFQLCEEPELIFITDWEGDGVLCPYVVVPEGFDDKELLEIQLQEHFPNMPIYEILRNGQGGVTFYDIATERFPEDIDFE